MTQEYINRNRELYIKEFNATGLPGVNHIISYLGSHHFFESQCHGHDREPGGTANHSLWVLKFARETRNAILAKHPDRTIPEDELVFTCLLHDICDCNPGHDNSHGGRSKHILEKRIKGFIFPYNVLAAVNAHMHGELHKGAQRSTQNSKSTVELIHYLVHNSDHRAIEYASGIPFGTKAKDRIFHKKTIHSTTVYFDKTENRFWWDNGYDIRRWKNDKDLTGLPVSDAKVIFHLFLREWPLEADFTIMENGQGNKALFVLQYLSGFGTPTLMSTDKAGFDYMEFVAYLSRYPQYRNSYILGRRTNGKWGVIAIKDQFKLNDDILIRITPKADYLYDNPDLALEAMDSNRKFRTRLSHTDFYKKITIK